MKVDYIICLKLLTGVSLGEIEFSKIKGSVGNIAGYFISINIFAYFAGKILQIIVFRFSKYKDSQFAFDTPWYYELKGKVSKVEDGPKVDPTVKIIPSTAEGKGEKILKKLYWLGGEYNYYPFRFPKKINCKKKSYSENFHRH